MGGQPGRYPGRRLGASLKRFFYAHEGIAYRLTVTGDVYSVETLRGSPGWIVIPATELVAALVGFAIAVAHDDYKVEDVPV